MVEDQHIMLRQTACGHVARKVPDEDLVFRGGGRRVCTRGRGGIVGYGRLYVMGWQKGCAGFRDR